MKYADEDYKAQLDKILNTAGFANMEATQCVTFYMGPEEMEKSRTFQKQLAEYLLRGFGIGLQAVTTDRITRTQFHSLKPGDRIRLVNDKICIVVKSWHRPEGLERFPSMIEIEPTEGIDEILLERHVIASIIPTP